MIILYIYREQVLPDVSILPCNTASHPEDLFVNEPTPWSRVLFDKLMTVAELGKCHAFYELENS